MGSTAGRRLYECADVALVRAARHIGFSLPAWPDLAGTGPARVEQGRAWLRQVWAVEAIAEAVEHASPLLARQVMELCAAGHPDARQVRRTVLSMSRYLLRMTGRATPFGLFAGVAAVSFDTEPAVRWGEDHHAVARADSVWLAAVTAELQSCPELLERLPVMTNNQCFVRGARLVVPYPPQSAGGHRAAPIEVSMLHTPAVQLAVSTARSPIRCDELVAKLAAEFPTADPSKIGGLLTDLVRQGVLISGLHAPAMVTDALGHLIEQLETADGGDIPRAAGTLRRLREIHESLAGHNHAAATGAGRGIRVAVSTRMTELSAASAQPVAVDLRVDCTLTLPREMAREAEAAASALARLTPFPYGTTAWQSYHTRFFERHGVGALVAVTDVVDPDVGIGFPAGYLGAEPEPRAVVSVRDQRLLALAQEVALDGREEIVLDERMVSDLAVGEPARTRVPPHLELRFQLHADTIDALRRGKFELAVVSASRGVGTMIGRSTALLEPADQARMASIMANLPASDPDTLPVQLSFAPLAFGDMHVTRTPELLPAVISLGEHRRPGGNGIELEDLAIGCDSRRLYLVSLSRRRRLEPTVLHALDLRSHTPPLARFLAEVGRAQAAVVTAFDWGIASALPFLPRVRYRRTILSPARWLLDRAALPGHRAPWPQWQEALAGWRARHRVASVVHLAEGDRRLRLDLDEPAHLGVLRSHLASADHAVLTEAPARGAHGWFGGRAHEIVTLMTAAQPPTWPAAPPVNATRVIGRDHGRPPAASEWLYAKLYGHLERQAEILARHLPELLSQWDSPPAWWYIRYRDPEWHLRLRIALPDAHDFGPAAGRVGTWAAGLRRRGLLRDVQFATSYPETGRWGNGVLLAAAEEVFGADSRALLAQFTQPTRPHPQALVAANLVAIATAFTGSPETGTDWLITHAKIAASTPLPRPVLAETVRLADPAESWAALRAAPGGRAIIEAWEPRHRALADYRALLDAANDINPDAVLDGLLHAHHIRAVGIDRDDERTCLRLARAAALTWNAHTTSGRR